MAPLPIYALSHFGTQQEIQLVLLLAIGVGLLLLSQPLRIPYPILLVLGGLGLGFVPGVPNVIMPPDIVVFGILPPLLYSAAFNTGLRELRQNLRAIGLLAVGLVAATMVSVAVVGHYAMHLSWATGFVLGAVVSPTDPLAASAIGRRFGVPRRALAIIEGESLVNDGTALVLFKFAVAAVVVGSFSLAHAAAAFVWSVVGGIGVGLAIGLRDPSHPAPARQPAARNHDRVPHGVLHVPARNGDRRVGRARGRHRGRLHGLAHA